jgi:DNA-binding NarL/FixJ family response regulator
MKIVDRRSVLLQGPVIDGEPTVMSVSSAPCLEAAWRYWEAAIASAFPAADGVATIDDLTSRQRQVAALLATGIGDEAIAASLGVSVRTVRSDVAALLDTLGVRSRFAAGVRLQLWSGQQD